MLGCSNVRPKIAKEDLDFQSIKAAIEEGNYDKAVKDAKETTNKFNTTLFSRNILYFEAYAIVYGWGDFQQARLPLKQLLDMDTNDFITIKAERLSADNLYWLGNYSKAIREYQNLESIQAGQYKNYAKLQIAKCLLLENKLGDALTIYRSLAEKFKMDLTADSAQLMIANVYMKLQNFNQAKTEFQKLESSTKNNKDIQISGQRALSLMEKKEFFQRRNGVPK